MVAERLTYYQMLPDDIVNALYNEIGSTIRAIRESRGIKQGELARSLDIHRTSLINIEQGRQKAPLHLLYALASRLGVEIQEILPEYSSLVDQKRLRISSKLENQINKTLTDESFSRDSILKFIHEVKLTNAKKKS